MKTAVNQATRRVTQAVLLAAGRGRRLRPHTDKTPKPLLPVAGKPTLDLYFESLVAAGVQRAVLVTHHLSEQVVAYAENVPMRFGLQCSTVYQNELNGTASALQAVMSSGSIELVNGYDKNASPAFLLMATDYLVAPDFINDFLTFHASHYADISVSLKRVPEAEISSRSSVRFGDDEHITEIVEKPAPGCAPSDLSANLAFIMPPGVCDHLNAVAASARGEREVQSAINAFLAQGGTARGLIQSPPSEWSPGLN